MSATEVISKAVDSNVFMRGVYQSFSAPNGYLRLLLRLLFG